MTSLDNLTIDQIKTELVKNPRLKARIIKNMQTYNRGNEFVASLSRCLLFADNSNLEKLITSFGDVIVQYQPSNGLK